jgi:anaerobic glycerol-3-phosphate dehydrogenase
VSVNGDAIILGAGAAGLAAAHVLVERGCRVHVVHGPAGASVLWNGVVDGLRADALPHERDLLSALGLQLSRPRPRIVNALGSPRSTYAHDAALLDLDAARPKVVLVPTLPRPAWDGRAIAAMLESHAHGAFEVRTVSMPRLLTPAEAPAADGAIAKALDDDERFAAFAQILEEALERFRNTAAALLLPPWLGVRVPRHGALAARVALPVGEVAGGLAGAPGLRFAHRRDAHLAKLGITVTRGRGASLDASTTGVSVTLEDGKVIAGSRLVVATGGFVSGAMEVPRSPVACDVPVEKRSVPGLAFHAPFLRVGAAGADVRANGSVFGTTPEDLVHTMRSRALLDELGVLTDDMLAPLGASELPVRVAGDAVANGPRVFGAALRDGIRAALSFFPKR